MKRIVHGKKSIGKLVIGMLVGGVLGALIGRLTATTSVASLGRRLTGTTGIRDSSRRSLEEKLKTAEGNVESTAHELAEEVDESTRAVKKASARRGKEPLPLDYGGE